MKTQHLLPNGTLLEVGKKYSAKTWENKDYYIEILSFGDKLMLVKNSSEQEFSARIDQDLFPYEPEQTKELAGYQEYYLYRVVDNTHLISVVYGRSKEEMAGLFDGVKIVYTQQEAAAAGLFDGEETKN